MNRRTIAVAMTAGSLIALGTALPAAAHGNISSSSPEAGARVKKPPRQVRLVLAEPPARGSGLTVIDGCGDVVSAKPRLDGDAISVAVDRGRPGRWQVRLRSISSVDGHAISDRFAFRVAGKRDCSGQVKEDDPQDDETDVDTSSRPPIENDEQGSSFPVVPFALGTVVVVGVAIALRAPRNTNKS